MSLIQTAAKPSSPLNTFLAAHNEKFGVLDVVDPENMGLYAALDMVGFANGGRYMGVRYSSKRNAVFVSTGFNSKGVIVIDLSDPFSPVQLTTILASTNVRGIALDEERDILFVPSASSSNTTVSAYDISDPAAVVFLGSHLPSDGGVTLDEACAVEYDATNQMLFITSVSTFERIAMIDASDPASMTTLEVDDDPNYYNVSEAVLLRPEIETAFLSSFRSSQAQIVSIDYSTPSAPVIRDSILSGDSNVFSALTVDARRDILIGLTNSSSTAFTLFDISDPDNIVQGASISGVGGGITLSGSGMSFNAETQTLYVSGINASTAIKTVAAYEIVDVNTINFIDYFIWVS